MSTSSVWFGIDVAKAHLDVARASAPGTQRLANTPAGWKRLVAELALTAQPSVVLEATGPYHRSLVLALAGGGIPTTVVNPAHLRYFARSQGSRAKTDAIDAQLIARYGAMTQPAPTPLPSASERALADLVSRRQDLVQDRVRERNRRAITTDLRILASIDRHLAMLTGELKALDQTIAAETAADARSATRTTVLRSAPGIGPVIAATLVAGLPELGTASPKQLAALVGVAPFARESGTQRWGRTITGGRAPIRRALYQAVVSATRTNPVLRTHLQRLLGRGKPYKVAMIATLRRFLGILNAMLRDGLDWSQTDVGQSRFLPT